MTKLCHTLYLIAVILKWVLQSKDVSFFFFLNAGNLDSSLLVSPPPLLHSHLRREGLRREEKRWGKESRMCTLRNEKNGCIYWKLVNMQKQITLRLPLNGLQHTVLHIRKTDTKCLTKQISKISVRKPFLQPLYQHVWLFLIYSIC